MFRSGFLKDHTNLPNLMLRVMDGFYVLALGYFSYFLSSAHSHNSLQGIESLPEHYWSVIVLAALLCILVFPLFGVYRVWRGMSTLAEIKKLTMAWMLMVFLLAVLAFVTQSGADYSRSWVGIWLVSTWVALVVSRIVLRLALRWLRSSGFNHRHIIIVGTGEQAMVVADRLMGTAWFGLEIEAFFGTDTGCLSKKYLDKVLIPDCESLSKYVLHHDIDQVWIALPHTEEAMIRDVINVLDGAKVEIRYVPDIFEYQLMHHSLAEMAGVPVVNISYSAIDGLNRVVKLMEDYLMAFLLLVLASPVMLLIAAGVKLSSPGSILYRQRRVGWNGKEFTMFKFRSMPLEAEKESGPVWGSQQDDRSTYFGSFLRKTSLDELPQLFNVLRGEMSLIGPRPERPMFVEKYKDEVPHYMKKHLVKAGMTGWAQVHGWRGNTCLHARIEHDLYYIENWSLWLDIKIVVMTIFRGLINRNAY